MKDQIIKLLKGNKLPREVAHELNINVFSIPYNTDYYYLLGLCEKLNLSSDDFDEIIDETFDDFGLKHFR
jgi:hypothetical protein